MVLPRTSLFPPRNSVPENERVLAGLLPHPSSQAAGGWGVVDPSEDLFSLSQYQQRQGDPSAALQTLSQIDEASPEMEARITRAQAAILGTGGFTWERAEYLADSFVDLVMDPAALGAMVGAGGIYRLSRTGFLRGLAPLLGEASAFRAGLPVAASGLAFGIEAVSFPFLHNLADTSLGHEVDYSPESLGQQIQSSFLVLGGLKAFGYLGRGVATRLAPSGGFPARLIPQAAMYLGIVSGRMGEQYFECGPQVSTTQILAEAMATWVHFNGMERLMSVARPVSLPSPVITRRPRHPFLEPTPQFASVTLGSSHLAETVSSSSRRPGQSGTVFMVGGNGEGSGGNGSDGRETRLPDRSEPRHDSKPRKPRRSSTPLAIPQEVYDRRQDLSRRSSQLKTLLWRFLEGPTTAGRALESLFAEDAQSLTEARPRALEGNHLHHFGYQKLMELGLAEEITVTGNGPRIGPTALGLEAFRFLTVGRGYGLDALPSRILSRMEQILGPLPQGDAEQVFFDAQPQELAQAFRHLLDQNLVAQFHGSRPPIFLITHEGRRRVAQWRRVQAQARAVLGGDLIQENLPPGLEIKHLAEGSSEPVGVPTVLIRRGIPVRPEQMIVSMGRGSMLTTRGGTDATRSAAMLGIGHPQTLARLAEDFRLVRYQGRNEFGQDAWVRRDSGETISAEGIVAEFGETLLQQSGIRPIPLEGSAQKLPVGHGALLPEALRTGERVLAWMGMSAAELKGTSLANQSRNYRFASDAGIYGLWAALSAQVGFGFPLHELTRLHPSRFGAAQGSAAPGIERWMEIHASALQGRDSLTYHLQSALLENARGLYLNSILPHFDFSELRQNPEALSRILPDQLAPGEMPRTGGVNTAFSQACASGLYALWGAHRAMIRTGIPGEYPMDAMMVMGVDATFSPYQTAPMVAGFSRKAPATITGMLSRLRQEGRLPEDIAAEYDAGESNLASLWPRLPESLRREAMNESSAPFTRWAQGLVVGEAAAAIPWMNFDSAIRMGLWPSSRLLGIGINAGEGGAANLAGMDQGVVTAIRVALNMANAHGQRPGLVQAHGTSTALNNIAELQSLYRALRYQGYSHPVVLNAIKGLVGHPMGAASAVDMVMGVQTLLEGRAPGLFNYRDADLDPRYAERIPEAMRQFRFPSEPVQNFGDSLMILSEGFLSSDAAAVLGTFPQDIAGAVELLRDYGFDAETIAAWKDRAPEHRGRMERLEDGMRRGELDLASIALGYGFNP